MNATENLLKSQLEDSRASAKIYKQVAMKMARASLKQLPREDLIEILVKKKIIQRDWIRGSTKYKIKENGE